MSNYDALNLYLVCEGEVMPVSDEAKAKFDGYESILVAATSEAAALNLADAYDRNEIELGTIAWYGATVAALYSRDELGNYA